MARIVVGSPNLTQPLLLYPGLGPAMLKQNRRSFLQLITWLRKTGHVILTVLFVTAWRKQHHIF
jgi:hypothetical protein